MSDDPNEIMDEYAEKIGNPADIPDAVAVWLRARGLYFSTLQKAIKRGTPVTAKDTDGNLMKLPEGAVR